MSGCIQWDWWDARHKHDLIFDWLSGVGIRGCIQGVLRKMRQPFGSRVPQGRSWRGRIKVNFSTTTKHNIKFCNHFHFLPCIYALTFQILNIQPRFEVCAEGPKGEAVKAENTCIYCIILHFLYFLQDFAPKWSLGLKPHTWGPLLMRVWRNWFTLWLRCQSIFSNKQKNW